MDANNIFTEINCFDSVCIQYLESIVLQRAKCDPVSSKRYKLEGSLIEDSDQTAHPRSLIRVFDERYMGSQGSIVSSGRKLRF